MQKNEQIIKTIDDFEIDATLWNIFTGGSGKALILLKKIVDSVQWQKVDKMPSILLYGDEGKQLLVQAFCNSLAIDDITEFEAKYFDVNSIEFLFETKPHNLLIKNIESLSPYNEPYIWQCLKNSHFQKYDHSTRGISYIYCNLIILTASNIDSVPSQLLNLVDYKIKVERFTAEQLELLILQRLKYLNISTSDSETNKILKQIVEIGMDLKNTIGLLKRCITVMHSEGRDNLTLKDVELAIKL
jgi:hypothetical protein